MVRQGKFHLVLWFGTGRDPSLTWISSHGQHVGPTYLCTPADVPAAPR